MKSRPMHIAMWARGFVIPSIYGYRRTRNRFRLNMENSPQNTSGRTAIFYSVGAEHNEQRWEKLDVGRHLRTVQTAGRGAGSWVFACTPAGVGRAWSRGSSRCCGICRRAAAALTDAVHWSRWRCRCVARGWRSRGWCVARRPRWSRRRRRSGSSRRCTSCSRWATSD